MRLVFARGIIGTALESQLRFLLSLRDRDTRRVSGPPPTMAKRSAGKSLRAIHLGTAGWTIPKQSAEHFPADGSHLARYTARFNAVEINSTFRQWHQPATFERWAAAVRPTFRFALKLPQAITHEACLARCDDLLARFVDETSGLGVKRGPLLIQLPPSLDFSRAVARRFFSGLRQMYSGSAVCEPRHASWFASAAEQMLVDYQIGRVAADPALAEHAGEPGGWMGISYYRWHGWPRVYYSNYDRGLLNALSQRLIASAAAAATWCIFDNTALGFATTNALETAGLIAAAGFNR